MLASSISGCLRHQHVIVGSRFMFFKTFIPARPCPWQQSTTNRSISSNPVAGVAELNKRHQILKQLQPKSALVMFCSHFILIFCLAALSAVETDGFSTVRRRTQHTTSLQLWPAVKDETNTDSVEQIVDENKQSTLLKKLFDTTGSSSLRSTSQTDALGQKTTTDTEESDESGIPPEVLKPFSLLILSQFILFLGVGAVIPAIPLYGQSIGLSSASNGIVISTPAVALLLVSRFAGVFADKGRKAAMMSGMFIIAIADAGTAFSNNLATLVVARLGLGLGRGLAEAGERGMLTDLANQTPKLRGRALAIQQASVGIGIAIGAPAGGYIVEEYGVRSSFLCVSAAAIAALGLYALLPETVGNSLTSVEASTTKVEEKSTENEADWMELFKTSQTWRSLTICQAGVSVGYACKIAIIPILGELFLFIAVLRPSFILFHNLIVVVFFVIL